LFPLLPGLRHENPEEAIQLLEFRPPMASIQNGELTAEGEILESQFRAEPQGDQNQREEAHDDRDHGREVSGPEARKVNPVNGAGVLAKDNPVQPSENNQIERLHDHHYKQNLHARRMDLKNSKMR
jgi:hypothetical protein